jgi:hypothetical protein
MLSFTAISRVCTIERALVLERWKKKKSRSDPQFLSSDIVDPLTGRFSRVCSHMFVCSLYFLFFMCIVDHLFSLLPGISGKLPHTGTYSVKAFQPSCIWRFILRLFFCITTTIYFFSSILIFVSFSSQRHEQYWFRIGGVVTLS